ncbi:Uma2 family endonuclease [Brevibacillus sp. SYP-B805]|nr:Uma2 family endonuclease [Brevibacillus sp. SYP-B805]
MTVKLSLYERFGVKEYWIVDPGNQYAQIYRLQDGGKYGAPSVYSREEAVTVGIFEDLTIDLQEIFG